MGGSVSDEERTVLIVDDNPDHCELMRVVGRRVAPQLSFRTVSDGQEALAYLAGDPPFHDRTEHPRPCLVLLDLMMPRVDGFGVLGGLQRLPTKDRMPVVVLTSSLNPVDEARALALGADAFFTKPAALDALGDLLEKVVARWVT